MYLKDKIKGTLYGQAIGDAMGMPSELRTMQEIKIDFKDKISKFLDGPENNDVAKHYSAGEYTDDTEQAFIILSSLIMNNWQADSTIISTNFIKWVDKEDIWNKNILGPSSKAALTLIKQGKDPKHITDKAVTNGCGMRISPIGTLFSPHELDNLVNMVYEITRITHSSDVAISGAAAISAAVSAAVVNYNWEDIVDTAIKASDIGLNLGHPTWATKIKNRIQLGIFLANKYKYNEENFCKAIYELLGTGTLASESIPAAISIAYYTQDVVRCAILCANIGGDTDTIGAMATAICGAKNGASSIPNNWIKIINNNNNKHDILKLSEEIYLYRSSNRRFINNGI